MVLLAWLVLIVTFIRLVITFINYLEGKSLPSADPADDLVSVIIPVRNEATTIATVLSDVCAQRQLNMEILVFDDESTDQTAELVRGRAESDNRIHLLSAILPEGWMGKNHACHQAAMQSKGRYLLFVDADVRLSDDVVSRAVHYLKQHKLSLLSLFPKQNCETLGEQLTVPLMNVILLSLLPLSLVPGSRFVSLSAANGQFMLFDRTAYELLLPHEKVKLQCLDDILIARYLKQQGHRVAVLAAEPGVECRMYTGFNEAVSGFSKNILHFVANSVPATLIFGLITTFGLIPIVMGWGLNGVLAYGSLVVLIRILVSLTSHQPVTLNLVLIVAQQLTLAWMMVVAAVRTYRKALKWKERPIC